MADLLVRIEDEDMLRMLYARAERHDLTPEEEIRLILTNRLPTPIMHDWDSTVDRRPLDRAPIRPTDDSPPQT